MLEMLAPRPFGLRSMSCRADMALELGAVAMGIYLALRQHQKPAGQGKLISLMAWRERSALSPAPLKSGGKSGWRALPIAKMCCVLPAQQQAQGKSMCCVHPVQIARA